MPIPAGVVIAKKHAIIVAERVLNWAWAMQPPSANPSKNWWKDNAAIKGLIVHGLCETPRDSPIITECDTIPSSKTYIVHTRKQLQMRRKSTWILEGIN